MELSISCEAAVKLDKMRDVQDVHCAINDFNVNGDALEGSIRIWGNYFKDDVENLHDFTDLVPFTIVFKDKNFQIDDIEVRDFEFQEIVNQGIECRFNIAVAYTPLEGAEAGTEEEAEIGAEVEEITAAEEKGEDVVEESAEEESAEEDVELSDDILKNEINQKYNELLNEILEARAEENFCAEEAKKAITINSGESRDDCRGFLRNLKSEQKAIKVFYTTKETDIESICRNERVSVEKVYRDNQKTDFLNKRRIIIK